ncbi:MAG: galactose oxidase [Bacteroidia bacterium]|nr:galactose oxidase [Bacteroidia bacterium]
MSLSSPETNFIADDTGANLTGDVKILFGANDFSHIKTTDLPSMNIKDICIYEKGKLKYNWPLDEIEGNYAKDKIQKKIAEIKNPVWLKPEHSNWQKVYSSTLTGNCEIAFNRQEEKIYLIGDDQMFIYSVKNNNSEAVNYQNKAKNLLAGRQAIYDPDTKSIFSYDIDQKTVSEFDFNTHTWHQEDPKNTLATVYLHHNQYYSQSEKSLYIFGGYGQHEYKNLIQRFEFNTGNWETIKPTGDIFNPRYLASAGELNDTIFILGGYGSLSGQQILNPQNYYDLMAFSIKEHKFKKLYNFVPNTEDICFSNSMVIDPVKRTFYALSFPVFKYDGYLQLIKGSLQKPELKPIAGKIRYLFHDVRSFSTLFCCESSKKLIAATLLLNKQNQSEINLFSISLPPNENTNEQKTEHNINSRWFWLLAFLGIIPVFYFLFLKLFRNGKNANVPDHLNSGLSHAPILNEHEADVAEKETYYNSVLFFGGFQVFNKKGTDITLRFTPLLKELFLLIWLYSIKNNKGISSEKLTELLWFDKDKNHACNNRAVNIAKLKQIIAEIDTCSLSHKTAYWKIEFNESVVFNDYLECIKITGNKKTLTKEKINKLIVLVNTGAFLMNSDYEWLDEFKADISNTIIDILIEFASIQKIEEDPDFILHLADSIFNCDIVNEEAMILKCKSLTLLGKHSLASNTYTKFSKDYKILYDQCYNKSFNEISVCL